jgi:hypothetical protein
MKTETLSLGGREYKVRHLNLGEIEEIENLFADDKIVGLKRSYMLLAIILRRASPDVADVRTIEASPVELNAAISRALIFSGLKSAEDADPNALAPAGGTG